MQVCFPAARCRQGAVRRPCGGGGCGCAVLLGTVSRLHVYLYLCVLLVLLRRMGKQSNMVGIMHLPREALIRVFGKLPVRDIATARQVCQAWNATITGHAAEIWKARCCELRLLPVPDEYDTVLGSYASETRRRAKITQFSEVAEVYRGHFRAWRRHVCSTPDAPEGRWNNPENFRWVCSSGDWVENESVRKIHWSWPAKLPPCWRGTPVLYRLDDILKVEQLRFDVHRSRVLEIKLIQAGKITT